MNGGAINIGVDRTVVVEQCEEKDLSRESEATVGYWMTGGWSMSGERDCLVSYEQE